MPQFPRCRFIFLASVAGFLLLVNGPLRADSFKIVGSFVTSNQVGPDFDGTFVLTYSVSGLPATNPTGSNIEGPSLALSNMDFDVSLENSYTLNSTLTGTIFAQNNIGTIYDYLSAVDGSGNGVRLIFASGFDGVGPLLANSNVDSSILVVIVPGIGRDDGDATSGNSFAVPEPSSISLGALGIGGAVWLLRRRWNLEH